MVKVVIGIGNPGREYEGTRHNLGFEVVEAVALARSGSFHPEGGNMQVAEVRMRGRVLRLIKPLTYVNRTGIIAARALGPQPALGEDLLVVCDDLDLPAGALRLRKKGSAGGHRGLESLVQTLGTVEFPRLRLGIGRPVRGVDPADYVLMRPPKDERALLDGAVARAAEAVEGWVREGLDACMNRFNRPSEEERREETEG